MELIKRGATVALGLALLTQTTMALAQESRFSNEAIWASGTFRTEYVWGIRSMADGKHYTTQEYDENKGSLARTVVFTIGHFIIAATILKILDPGIELWVAVTDAIIEPLVNSVWYYILDKWWVSKSKKRKAT